MTGLELAERGGPNAAHLARQVDLPQTPQVARSLQTISIEQANDRCGLPLTHLIRTIRTRLGNVPRGFVRPTHGHHARR